VARDVLCVQFTLYCYNNDRAGARGTMLQAGRLRVQFTIRSLDFFNLPNPSSRTIALGSTQPLTEMSTRKIRGGVKGSRCVRLTT
jgi:hypothetical protein